MVRTYSWRFGTYFLHNSDRDPREVYVRRQKWWNSKVEVTEAKPSSFQHVVLQQKCLLCYSAICSMQCTN